MGADLDIDTVSTKSQSIIIYGTMATVVYLQETAGKKAQQLLVFEQKSACM